MNQEGCDVVFRTEVNKTAHADETATVREVSTNSVPLEECCDVVIKPADDEADGTEEADTIQEGSKYSVHKEESCVVQISLQCHNISHYGVKPFTCTICNTSFTHKTRLMSHERFHSREKSAPLATQSNNLLRYCGMLHSGVKRYTCRKCNRLLTHIASLMSHERVHSRDSTVSFATKSSNLGYHDKLYSSVKQHACAVCNKSFANKSSIRPHELSHATKNELSHATKNDHN